MPKSFIARSVLIICTALIIIAATFLGMNNFDQKSAPKQAKALVGGSFQLVDHTGKAVSEKDFLGKYMFIYFGYTYCCVFRGDPATHTDFIRPVIPEHPATPI